MFQFVIFFLFYQILSLFIILIFPLIFVITKFKHKNIEKHLCERLGFVPKNHNKNTVWIHGASIGELLSIQYLIKKIRQNKKVESIYITSSSISGRNLIEKNFNADNISLLPFDFLFSILLAFSRIKPSYLIIVEAELWPNLLFIAKLKKIPIYLINARIKKKSKKKYSLLKKLYEILFNNFNLILTQSNEDILNLKKFNLKKTKISLLGNLKSFNVLIKKKDTEDFLASKKRLVVIKHKILLIGSMHKGEEVIFLELFLKLKKIFSELKLILVPRHFYWKSELISTIEKFNLKFFIWNNNISVDSQNYNNFLKKLLSDNDILLVLKFGELFKLYSFSTISYLGGTFIKHGGHNIYEPAVWSNLIISGPYHYNCDYSINSLRSRNGIIITHSKEELYIYTEKALKNSKNFITIRNNSYNWIYEEALFVNKQIGKLIENL